MLGIQRFNADGSINPQSYFSDGGYAWSGNGLGPWKLEVGADDRVYVADLGSNVVLSFDQTLSSNSSAAVLRSDNWPNPTSNSAVHSLPARARTCSFGCGHRNSRRRGNPALESGALGVAATNDMGTNIVQSGGGSDLGIAPFDVAVDRAGRIYTIQNRTNANELVNRILRFPAYNESGIPEITADWKRASSNSFFGAQGIAINPAGTLVAVAFLESAETLILDAATGTNVFTITSGLGNQYHDAAWDNAAMSILWMGSIPPGASILLPEPMRRRQLRFPSCRSSGCRP